MSRSTLLVSSLGLLIASSSTMAFTGTYYSLGASKFASSVNADGTVVVGTAAAGQPYWIWTMANQTPTNIGGVSAGNGVGGTAKVSNDGTKVSGSMSGFNGAPIIPTTVLYQAATYDVPTGQWTALGGIGWYSGTETASGWAISGDGHVLVGLGWSPNQTTAYAIKSVDNGPLTALPWLVPGRSTRANGCNDNGSVVVGWCDRPDGIRCAAIWNNGVGQRLWYSYPTMPAGEAQACSADGTWVVGIGGLLPNAQAWRWSQATGVQLLGELITTPGNAAVGLATDITADGSMIVGFERDTTVVPGILRPFIWTQANGMQDFTNYVTSQGVVIPAGVTLGNLSGVSDDGRTFVGTTTGSVGFVIRLDPPADPTGCEGDFNGDGQVNVVDLLGVVSAWGACSKAMVCPADFNHDGQVNTGDLLSVISAWGACP